LKRCVIFCAGGFSELICPIAPGDLVIAADGGYVHTQALGIAPHMVLGDFDSLGYVPQGALRHPVEKDDTDTGLAVAQGLKEGCDTFLLYGSLDGPRLDHTVANFQALIGLAKKGARGYLIGQTQIVTVLQGGTLHFAAGCRGDISVFAVGGSATGVTLQGLKYPLQKHTLTTDFPLGVSNAFTGEAASIAAENGLLLIVYGRENGLPQEAANPGAPYGLCRKNR